MKNIFSIAILFLFISFNTNAQEVKNSDLHITGALIGEWIIDLRPTAASEPYLQPFVVDSIEENTLKGTFYGSNLENALLNDSWQKLYFAFTTRDSNNEYYHSGYLEDGKLYGISYCPNRNFTAPWTGTKK